jgi:Mor family transcriptional regulator
MAEFIEELRGLDIPETIIIKIHTHFSGCSIYVPKANKADLTTRNTQIYQRFNGKNYRELAREFKLSGQYIHKIVSRERCQNLHR